MIIKSDEFYYMDYNGALKSCILTVKENNSNKKHRNHLQIIMLDKHKIKVNLKLGLINCFSNLCLKILE